MHFAELHKGRRGCRTVVAQHAHGLRAVPGGVRVGAEAAVHKAHVAGEVGRLQVQVEAGYLHAAAFGLLLSQWWFAPRSASRCVVWRPHGSQAIFPRDLHAK